MLILTRLSERPLLSLASDIMWKIGLSGEVMSMMSGSIVDAVMQLLSNIFIKMQIKFVK